MKKTRGMTLLEVVAAAALLATLLAGMMLAKSRLRRQYTWANQRVQTLVHLDDLMYQWHQAGAFPTEGGGPLGDTALEWRAEVRDDAADDENDLPVVVVRITVTDPEDLEQTVIASVDVLTPLPDPAQQEGQTLEQTLDGGEGQT